jgi:flagellar FliJ protein
MEPNNLRMLIELAVTARDAAATQRARAQRQVDLARAQLDTLKGYATDYERRSFDTLTAGSDIAVQNNLRAFVAKLGRAIDQQAQEVTRRAQALAGADVELAFTERKLKSLEVLRSRRVDAARRLADQREQKSVDEIAQRVVARAAGWTE